MWSSGILLHSLRDFCRPLMDFNTHLRSTREQQGEEKGRGAEGIGKGGRGREDGDRSLWKVKAREQEGKERRRGAEGKEGRTEQKCYGNGRLVSKRETKREEERLE